MSNEITDKNPNVAPFPDVPPAPKDAGATVNPSSSPLQSPNPRIRAAWQAALRTIRKKNIAAQSNNGQRVPLA